VNTWRIQGLRYIIVGLASNLVLYLLYLLLTTVGLGHKTSMTLLYVVGTLQTFIFNKRWTFEHDGATHKAFMRYIAAYAFGYLLNLTVLWVAVDHLGLPHQVVQGVMVIIVAMMVFLLQKFWVFSDRLPRAGEAT
jgi:putative flippase GtrA